MVDAVLRALDDLGRIAVPNDAARSVREPIRSARIVGGINAGQEAQSVISQLTDRSIYVLAVHFDIHSFTS